MRNSHSLCCLIFLSIVAQTFLYTPSFAEDKSEKGTFDQGLYEDALPQTPAGPIAKPTEWTLGIAMNITVDYVFLNPTKDNFKVKYQLVLGGPIGQTTGVIRGNAKIVSTVSGELAKWNLGQCLLQVSVADVPYEIQFNRDSDTKVHLQVHFKRAIMEDWQSTCTFLDAPDSRFNTKGEPEKWIAGALQKTDPALDKLIASISLKDKTETKFSIPKHTIKDETIGSAEVAGTATITLTPPDVLPEEKK